jgi:hypothetical protein
MSSGGSGDAVPDEDPRKAALYVLRIDGSSRHAHAEQYSWRAATAKFLALRRPLPPGALVAHAAPGVAH